MMPMLADAIRLDLDRLQRRPAMDRGVSHCVRCGHCCQRATCSVSREDLERLAKHLGMSRRDVFRKHLVVDRHSFGLLIKVRRLWQLGGTFLTTDQSWSDERCVFFTDGSPSFCEIHDAKPTEGQRQACWESTRPTKPKTWTRRALIALGWDGRERT